MSLLYSNIHVATNKYACPGTYDIRKGNMHATGS